VFAAQKMVLRCLSEKGHRFLVIRKVGTTLRNSCFAEIQNIISTWGLSKLFNINKTDMEMTCKNGNKVIFCGLDDSEKLKSISGITSMWVEEASELEQQDLQQLDLRLRGKTEHYKQIIISFNPISILHWLKTYFFDAKREGVKTLHSTYKDNRFIDDEYKAVLEGMKDTDEYYYNVYCLGRWGILGKTIFPAQIVNDRVEELMDKNPLKRGFFDYRYLNERIVDGTIRWVDDPNGYIAIYKEPLKGVPYVIGGDTAGEGSDYFAGQVLDNLTGEQVAVLRHQFDEDLYTRQMYCLGKHYNTALQAIEINFSTFPVKEMQRLGYWNQFKREAIDEITKKRYHKFGFQTSKLSRPLIIAGLVQVVREHIELFNDIQTLEEMLTFVRNEKGKAEAQGGKTDDLIMSLAIAHFARGQGLRAIEGSRSVLPEDLPKDLLDDLMQDPAALEHYLSEHPELG
jgi:phage terminase large subunit